MLSFRNLRVPPANSALRNGSFKILLRKTTFGVSISLLLSADLQGFACRKIPYLCHLLFFMQFYFRYRFLDTMRLILLRNEPQCIKALKHWILSAAQIILYSFTINFMFFSNQVQRLLFPLPQTMFNMGLNIYISHLKDSIISKIYSRLLFQHIFNKISVSSFGIVYKNVRHSPHKLIILNYGTSAHPLHNSTDLFQKPFVPYFR